jgi:uncharacterized membrane protein
LEERVTLSGILWVILLTLTPTFELRASIPYALLIEEWPWWLAGPVGIAANAALAPLVWVFVDKVVHLFLRIAWIKRLYDWMAARSVSRLEPYVLKYGVLGLALFIGVPFPGTGVYSGCLAAWLLKFRFRDYLVASALGCVIAGTAVTAVVASGSHAFDFMVKGP